MKQAQTFSELYGQVADRKVPFFLVFFGIVTISYAVLVVTDIVPEPIEEGTQTEEKTVFSRVQNVVRVINGGLRPQVVEPEEEAAGFRIVIPEDDTEEEIEPEEVSVSNVDPLPVSITFESLDGRTIDVLNPVTSDISTLDEALLEGAVRHPESADFARTGNIFILAHSSYLPNVFNKNFQAFNGIQGLTWGDMVTVRSGDVAYTYKVDRVYKAKAGEVTVPITTGEAKLTLSTCNSFAAKDDRFIVEASLYQTETL